MQFHHYVMLGIVAVVAYAIGAKWPAMAQKFGFA